MDRVFLVHDSCFLKCTSPFVLLFYTQNIIDRDLSRHSFIALMFESDSGQKLVHDKLQ